MWIVNELIRIRDYSHKPHEFVFWRERDHKIDILVLKNNVVILAIECKSGSADLKASTIAIFRGRFPNVRLIVASMIDERKRTAGGVEVFPWREALEVYRSLQ